MNRSRCLALLVIALLCTASLGGCNRYGKTSAVGIFLDPSPTKFTTNKSLQQEIMEDRLVVDFNTQTGIEDAERILFLDQPLKLTPHSMP